MIKNIKEIAFLLNENGYTPLLSNDNTELNSFISSCISKSSSLLNDHYNSLSQGKKLEYLFDKLTDWENECLLNKISVKINSNEKHEKFYLKRKDTIQQINNKIEEIRQSLGTKKKIIIPEIEIKQLFKNFSLEKENKVSTIEEQLRNIADFIEHKLKINKHFIKIKEDSNINNWVNNVIITDLRKELQIFRHQTEDAILKRKKISEVEKNFLLNYGLSICVYIDSKILKNEIETN